MADFLKDLNDAQREAVLCTDGPVMVIAGAGSGKTRVLTYRVAYLLNIGADPFQILALTFTNKAAREMKERIIKIVGFADAKNVWMGTFHSIFARILRIEGHRLGYPNNFTIYDTDDSKTLIKQIIKENELDDKTYQPNYVMSRISGAKTNLISSREYNDNSEIQQQDRMSGKPRMGEIYSLYDQRLMRASAMDFDDLLFKMNILLRDFPEVLYKYQQQFKYILVDEYQDTNYAQYLIVKKLAANNENICVVGDDAQSIYAFRGANIKNILNLKNDYPDMKVFKLEQNYRSTKNIVNAANSIIVNNKEQIFKEIWTDNDDGEKIQLLKATTDNEEGQLVARSIFEQKMQQQLMNSSFAVLYRTNAQSRAMEEALRKLNIPYKIFGGLSFYKRKEIKDLIAYFRLSLNHNDEEALWRIINYPNRKIGKTTQEKIMVEADKNNKSPWEIVDNIKSYGFGSAGEKIADFANMIKSFAAMAKSKNAWSVADHIVRSSGLLKDLSEDTTIEGIGRQQNIEELLNGIKAFSETEEAENNEAPQKLLAEYIQDISLLTDAEDPDKKDDSDYVSLMTIHAAKGLEFPHVYIVGVEENLFPSMQSLGTRTELEEERRLFYVALTRAMKRATVSYSETRYKWGNLNFCEPSRFIEELNPNYIDFPKRKTVQTDEFIFDTGSKQKIFSPKPTQPGISVKKNFVPIEKAKPKTAINIEFTENITEKLQVGMQVEHAKFGNGKVISIEGNAVDKKAIVFFENIGQKQLLLKFAKLKILE
ncbi:MAG TPA: UvrD-helicase domain-containing protein [Bacteroidales bacterium]|mgnify:CR=1 FL=1|nr:UvrD-helicase domain-containing protein [Bacteroidales bacterium]HPS17736.1 UvrD-helicase domain-containing protein [Bacteroidales bacterium]